MLNPRGERIQDDLRGLIDGEVFADSVSTQAYATDSGLYEILPACVVFPRTTMDIVSVIRYARRNGLSVHPRGSGSNCVGAALGEGIVLDMSRYMRRLLHYEAESNVLVVQAGMQCSRLNEILRPHRRQILPGAGHSWPNTIGGLLSMDGYGSRWLSFGRPSDWLLELEMVTANGNIVRFSNQELLDAPRYSEIPSDGAEASSEQGGTAAWNLDLHFPDGESEEIFNPEKLAEPEPFFTPQEEKKWILTSISHLLKEYSAQQRIPHTPRVIDKMAYWTNIQNGNRLNMARLIAGAEGTLGVISAVKLQLPEIPAVRKTLLLFFDSMEKAMRSVQSLLPFHPDACELIDRRYLHLAAERDVRFDTMFPEKTEAVLLIELTDSAQFSLLNRLRSLSDKLIRQNELAFQMIVSADDAEADLFWELARTFEPSVHFGKGKPIRNPLVEDAAVMPSRLHEFFLRVQELLRKHELTAAFFSHAIQGQVRLQPLVDLFREEEAARLLRFAREYYQLVHGMNGTIGTENGLGLGWTYWMPLFEHPKYEITCAIKRVFDPFLLFQPGKMGSEIDPNARPEAMELLWRRAIRPSAALPLEQELPTLDAGSDSMKDPLTDCTVSDWTGPENTGLENTGLDSAAGVGKERSTLGERFRNAERSSNEEILESAALAKKRRETIGTVSGDPKKTGTETAGTGTGTGTGTDPDSLASSNVLDDPAILSADRSSFCGRESSILVMEKVREILGNAFDDLADETYAEDGILRPSEDEKNEEESGKMAPLTHLGLAWHPEKIRKITDRCNGCAKCRGTELSCRACPVFRYDCSEFSSPRAKANLMAGLVSETLDVTELGDDAFRSIMNQCIQCHSCRIECTSGVDVPYLVRSAKESWAKAHGLDFYETSLVRLDVWVKRFRRFPYLANLAFSTGWMRWLIEKSFGISKDRKIPNLETRSFLEKLQKNPALLASNPFERPLSEHPIFLDNSTGIQGKAVYFVDTYANYFDSSVARAVVQVFQHNHVPLVVPLHQVGCGITAVMLGRSDYVKTQVYRNAALLADYVRQGYDVVVSEPAAALAFRWEFPQTYPENEDIQLVARHCFEVSEYLYKLHVNQLLKMPKLRRELRVGYHTPCRLRALQVGVPSTYILRLIPGLELIQSPHGCCGMGGFFGMLAKNYSASLKIGRPLQAWMRDPTIQIGATECSACRIQMMHKNTKSVLHPIQILAQAYGL
ncbi:MAG: FAD-binding protein [Thermoguttaceae bacterium]|nr:FAD-binding protein [Thermoguttaceae bacterium]